MATVALIAWPSLASAQSVPNTPTISGTLQVGKTLTATSGGASGTETGYVWLRCEDTSDDRCTWLSAYERTYTLQPTDLNRYMRVVSWARRGYSYAYKLSNSTGKVLAAPTPVPTPVKTPVPTATPVKTPVATATPVKTPVPTATPVKTPVATATVTPGGTVPPVATPTPTFEVAAQPTPEVAPVAQPDPPAGEVLGATDAKAPKMLKPYPVVRISGRLTTSGANIKVLSVKAPKGSKITVRCTGKGCPRKSVARATKVVRISQFQRVLPAGIRLRITIAKPGYISKVTTISIRKGKAPLRSDQCQMPGEKKLIRCPK